MGLYAIIAAYQEDYQNADSLRCITTRPTKQEAEDVVRDIKEQNKADIIAREAYVDDYVSKLEIPEEPGEKCDAFFEMFPFLQQSFVKNYFMNNFHHPQAWRFEVSIQLKRGHECKDPQYSPPRRFLTTDENEDLFVVEIK